MSTVLRRQPRTRALLWACAAAALFGGRAVSARAGDEAALDFAGKTLRGNRIVDAAGQEVWRLNTDQAPGAALRLSPDGSLVFAGHSYGEATASLVQRGILPGRDFVFEARFTYTRPQLLYGHLFFIALRVGDLTQGSGYRISYRFAGPSPFSFNNTGFFLYNTASEEYRKDPAYSPPIAGAKYRLIYGREYVAHAVIADVADGVNVKFYLHDPTVAGDDDQPLFEYTDRSAERVAGDGDVGLQIGSGAIAYPAAPVYFRGLRVYSLERFAQLRARPKELRPAVPSDLGDHPARTLIADAVCEGLVQAYPDGTFHPAESVSVGAFSAMLAAAKLPGLAPDELADPARPVTRAQLALAAVRAVGEPYPTDLQPYTTLIAGFDSLSQDVQAAAARALAGGLVSLDPDGVFRPAANATRADCAVVLSRIIHEGTREAPKVYAGTELPNLFGDDMVLQQRKRIPVWGHGINGDTITVSLADQQARATVVNGNWKAELEPLPAGGPYVLRVKGSDKTIEVKSVLVGEVWVLGGQSNMSWYLESTTGAEEELPKSDYPDIRVFAGWHPAADWPQFNLAGGTWKAISPKLQGRFSAVGYYFAKELHQRLKVPIGLVDVSTPATGIEVWMSEKAAGVAYARELRESHGQTPASLQDPSVYFNGKVAPIMPAGIAGFLWYQGDGSSPEAGYSYRKYIPLLMQGWRDGFGQGDLPFLIMQIPRFKGCSPEMRESQLLSVLQARNSGLAVALEAGEPDDIHPKNKRPMGERLALIARAVAYGEKIEYMGPIYRSFEVKDGKAYLSFDHRGSGLLLKGSSGFEICGADRRYVPAEAAITDDNRVVVWSNDVTRLEAVRYAWANVPEFSLYNKEGLLASPFRTRED